MRGRYAILFALLPCTAFCSDPTKEVVAPGLGAKLDNYLRRLEAFDYSGAMLVEYKGQIILNKGYGYANRERKIANRPDTIFDVGSLAKQFTATEILLLERAGKLKTTDTLGTYLTDAPERLRNVTIQQLLTHTGGIPSVIGFKEELKREEVLKRIWEGEPAFPAGSQFDYSNEGYILLANIVQVASGRSYNDVLREFLFDKVGMKSTGSWGKAAPRAPSSRFALGYDDAGVTFDIQKANGDNWADKGGGQITSNLPDLYHWAKAIFNSDFLTTDERARMFKPVKPLDKPIPAWFSSEYGYGWFVQTLPDGRLRIQHGGDSFGFGCEVAWYPADQLLMISLCNTRHDVFPDHVRADRIVPQIIFGEAHDEPPMVATASRDLKRYVGTYRLDTGDKLIIYDRGDRIMAGADGQSAASLLDQAPKEQRETIEGQEKVYKVSIGKLFARDYEFWKKLDARKPFVDGVNDEIAKYGKDLGKPLGGRSLGTYQGGFVDYASIWEVQFERGALPYKIEWTKEGIAATWEFSPPYAAPTPLAIGPNGELVGWNLYTKRGFTITIKGDRLDLEGPNGKGTAHKVPLRTG